MKKLFAFLLVILCVFSCFSLTGSALFDSGTVTSQLRSKIYYMENLDEGTVFFEKNSNEKVPAAGFVKVLAAVVAIEKWGNLDGNIKITEKNLNLIDYEYGMTTALYEEGETVSKRELFDCLVVYSANDALSVIAYEIAGSEAKFVQEMQNLAVKIGCSSTSIKNIHGFDQEGQYTTAADVAKIIKYAINYPAFNEAFSASEVVLKQTDKNEARTYSASNQMKNAAIADYYHSSVTGGKQTSTDLAGECIAVISNADGYSYLTIVLGGEYTDIDDDDYDENTSMTDAQMMLDWVYENIRYKVIASPEQTVATVDVIAGKGSEKLRLVPEKETSALVPLTATPASVMFEFADGKAPESVVAPVKNGDIIAQANVYYAGQKLTTVNIVAADSVKLSFGGLVVAGIKSVVGSVVFLILSLSAAAVAVLKFALDLKDYLDKDRKKSYDRLPSSFEMLCEKVKKTLTFGKKKPVKKSRKTDAKRSPATPQKAQGKTPLKKQRFPEKTVQKKSPSASVAKKSPEVKKKKMPEKTRPDKKEAKKKLK